MTAQGTRCRNPALDGKQVCGYHASATRGGRPTKLTQQVEDSIVQVLRVGGYLETAAKTAGVSRSQVFHWLKRGDPAGNSPKDAPYRRFRLRVEGARAEVEARNVALITRAASDNWQAAAWLLERMYPDRWARPSQRDKDAPQATHGVTDDPFVEVDELAAKRRKQRT